MERIRGLPLKILAFEQFLIKYSKWRGQVVLYQVRSRPGRDRKMMWVIDHLASLSHLRSLLDTMIIISPHSSSPEPQPPTGALAIPTFVPPWPQRGIPTHAHVARLITFPTFVLLLRQCGIPAGERGDDYSKTKREVTALVERVNQAFLGPDGQLPIIFEEVEVRETRERGREGGRGERETRWREREGGEREREMKREIQGGRKGRGKERDREGRLAWRMRSVVCDALVLRSRSR
jgi:hypothetical protein